MSILASYPLMHSTLHALSYPKTLSREKVSYIEPVFHTVMRFMCYERLTPQSGQRRQFLLSDWGQVLPRSHLTPPQLDCMCIYYRIFFNFIKFINVLFIIFFYYFRNLSLSLSHMIILDSPFFFRMTNYIYPTYSYPKQVFPNLKKGHGTHDTVLSYLASLPSINPR